MLKADRDESFSPPRQERRAHLRVGVRARMQLRGSVKLTVAGWARNVSLGGVFVECDSFFPIDSACILTFSVREGDVLHTVTAEAVVRHHNHTGMGLEFHGLVAESRQIIERLVAGDFPEPENP
ncbi:MAG: PilZ domain-containing protein [Nitrospirota bacterium]|nr:PilZ domain-containing protein [Nitrospirota bacterium]